MDSAMVAGIVRAILGAAGGALVSKGYIDSGTLEASIGAIVVLLTAGWSIVAKKKAAVK